MGNQALKIFKFAAPAIILAAIVFFLPMLAQQDSTVKKIRVGGSELSVASADTDALKQRGLAGQKNLAPEAGMLFVYPDQDIRYFWMKDMKFPLDVIWISGNKVIGVQENIPYQSQDGQAARFHSNAPADMVLEVNAGWIKSHNIRVGDRVDISKI